MTGLLRDLRYAVRQLRKRPGFTTVVVLTLALGIGANITVFSVLNAIFLRPLPYSHPERLVWATEYFPKFHRDQIFTPEYLAWRSQSRAFDQLEAQGTSLGVTMRSGNRPGERIQAGHVTPGYFMMLGVQPQIGRVFTTDDHPSGPVELAVLSASLWRNYFQKDPHILGQTIYLDGKPVSIVGVMPQSFLDSIAPDTGIWLPDAVNKNELPARAMTLVSNVIGRLRPGVSPEMAQASLDLVARRMDSQYPAPWSSYHRAARVVVRPLQDQLTAGSRTLVYVIMGAAGFILLIACANVANMLLSRVLAREGELALRAAIGATGSRLVQLLMAEGVALGLCGGLLGIILAIWGKSLLGFLVPLGIPQRIPIDWRILIFAVLCSLASSVIFGLTPAFSASKLDLNTSLKEGGLHSPYRRHGAAIRKVLAGFQVALSLVLLAGAGLLIRSLVTLVSVDPGFDVHNVLIAAVSLNPAESYSSGEQKRFFQSALDAIHRIPGVEHVGITDESPLKTFQSLMSGLAAEGQPESDVTVVPSAVSADYFSALKIPLLEGRFFNDRDAERHVIILNHTLARILFPNVDPLGRRVRWGDTNESSATVVGVVGDIRHRGLDDKVWPELFQPYQQAPSPWMSFVIRSSGAPLSLVPQVREAVAGIDRNQPLFDVESLEQRLSNSFAQRRQRTLLLASFAITAFVIAIFGIYGVMSYAVVRRTHEIGIRTALGAQPSSILRMVVTEGMRIALAGVAVGLIGAVGLTHVLSAFLYKTTPTDTMTFLSVTLLVLTSTLIAAYIPARRAAKIEPMEALRYE